MNPVPTIFGGPRYLVVFTLAVALLPSAARAGMIAPNQPGNCKPPAGPASATAFWDAMTCLHGAHDYKAAAAVGEALVSQHPGELRAYFITSWFYWTQSQREVGKIEAELTAKALGLLDRAIAAQPDSWEAYQERGDYHFLRSKDLPRAYADYLAARERYGPATPGRKASVENRVARVAEKLKRSGEAVEASCRAVYFDPDDPSAIERIKRLQGSCMRKKVADPRTTSSSDAPKAPAKAAGAVSEH